MSFVLRRVTDADKWDVHAWRNEPVVRQAMLTSHEISRDEHDAWWDRKMPDPNFAMMLFEEDGVAKAVHTYFDMADDKTAWWAFYFTPHAPEDLGPMMKLWKMTELSGLSYAFDTLKRDRLFIEVLRSNKGVLDWHKRFGFKACDPSVSDNVEHHDLEVMDYRRTAYQKMRDTRWSADLARIETR